MITELQSRDWFGSVEASGQLSNHLEEDLQRLLIFDSGKYQHESLR